MRFQVITEVLTKCLLFGLERRSDWYIGDDVSKERGTLIFRVLDMLELLFSETSVTTYQSTRR